MTIFEVARYVPLGSRVTLYEWDSRHTLPDPEKRHRGVVTQLQYGDGNSAHTVILREKNAVCVYPVSSIADIRIEEQPSDYDCSEAGISVDQAAWRMLEPVREYMKYMNSAKRQELELVFQTEFPVEAENIRFALKHAGLDNACELLEKWRQFSFDQWQMLFRELYDAKRVAEQSGSPDLRCLRRAEAYICCRARKENYFVYETESTDPIAYAISLLVRNLAEGEAKVRSEAKFGKEPVQKELALDWFLLALCYYRSGMHDSCAYAALVQSALHLGRFFHDRKNRRMFLHLCGGAHDFTFLRYMMEHYRDADDADPMEALKDLGKCICWMMYQMGGSGIFDAADLLASIEGCTAASLPQLRERALAYVCKYAPRNRNDRYMAVTEAMSLLLERIRKYRPDGTTEYRFGYLYEFHGGDGLPLSYYDGFILGEDFLSYRISYPADTYNRLPLMIQAKSARSREYGERAVLGVWFYPTPSGLLYRYQADSEIEFENGGIFDV